MHGNVSNLAETSFFSMRFIIVRQMRIDLNLSRSFRCDFDVSCGEQEFDSSSGWKICHPDILLWRNMKTTTMGKEKKIPKHLIKRYSRQYNQIFGNFFRYAAFRKAFSIVITAIVHGSNTPICTIVS